MQKPSEGAIRVVEKLRLSPHVVVFDIEEAALIIDSETGWILCSERMPTDGEKVLVWFDKWKLMQTWNWKAKNRQMLKEIGTVFSQWQPLPTPPKES